MEATIKLDGSKCSCENPLSRTFVEFLFRVSACVLWMGGFILPFLFHSQPFAYFLNDLSLATHFIHTGTWTYDETRNTGDMQWLTSNNGIIVSKLFCQYAFVSVTAQSVHIFPELLRAVVLVCQLIYAHNNRRYVYSIHANITIIHLCSKWSLKAFNYNNAFKMNFGCTKKFSNDFMIVNGPPDVFTPNPDLQSISRYLK